MKLGKAFSVRLLMVLVLLVAVVSLVTTTMVWAQPGADPSASPSPSATAKASPTSTPAGRIVFGQVSSIASDKTSFTIQRDDQSPITIKVNSSTSYFVLNVSSTSFPGMCNDMLNMMGWWDSSGMNDGSGMGDMSPDDSMPGSMHNSIKSGKFSDITVGGIVVARGLTDGNLARQVFILEFPDSIKFLQGTVKSVSSNSITAFYDSSAKLFRNATIRITAATPSASPTVTSTPASQ